MSDYIKTLCETRKRVRDSKEEIIERLLHKYREKTERLSRHLIGEGKAEQEAVTPEILLKSLADDLRYEIQSEPWIDKVKCEALLFDFRTKCIPDLKFDLPDISLETTRATVAIASMGGALIGYMAGGFVPASWGQQGAVIMILCAFLGAGSVPLIVLYLIEHPRMKTAIKAAAGGVLLWSVVKTVLDFGPMGFIRTMIGSRDGSTLKTVLISVAVLVVLFASRERRTVNGEQFDARLRSALEDWFEKVEYAIAGLETTAELATVRNDRHRDLEQFVELGEACQILRESSPEELVGAATGLLDTARAVGFNGIIRPYRFACQGKCQVGGDSSRIVFAWSEEERIRYETFGEVEEGDSVVVARTPVLKDGEIIERGKVRRNRKA